MTRLLPTRTLLILVLVLAVQGCDGDPVAPAGVFFPTVPVGGEYPAGDIEGTLEFRSGCLFLSRPEDRWLLLWPEGFTARVTEARVEVVDASGAVVAREGELLRVGGGETNPLEVGGTAEAEQHAADLTGLDIPERCSDLYWLVSP